MSITKQYKDEWKDQIPENLDRGESVFGLFRGEALERLTGRMTDEEALSLGHFDGLTNVTLNTIKTTEEGLNMLSSIEPELVPMIKRIKKADMKESDIEYKKGMVWITDEEEAKSLGKKEGYDIQLVEGKYYFDYPGLRYQDNLMTKFVYNIARASGSLQGETKTGGFEAVANLKVVPSFSTTLPQGQWGEPPTEEDGE